jgi:DNA-binding winged helix-turn-helix (wHTH) protein/tetratricopeptide (TPR) repeat protein
MARGQPVCFGPFRLDLSRRELARDGVVVTLRPKTLEVLLHLLRNAGEIVSKDELLAAVWEGRAVSEYVLTTCISELRSALGDEPKTSLFLRTVHRTGYQFLATAFSGEEPAHAGAPLADGTAPVIGRAGELAQLHAALQRALAGERQVVFVTGELGIGKTTLADAFLRAVAAGAGDGPVMPRIVARGQCVDQYGAGEPYMPVFEAIGRLGREFAGPLVVDVLRRHAPAWLAQIPGMLPPAECAALRRELPAATQEHMLRQIADGIEALGDHRLLVLLLEDLHLSDQATLQLIAALALRRGPAKLLIVGTFRDAEAHSGTASFHDVKQNLLVHRQCVEIALAPLTLEAVDTYLARRFPGVIVPPGLAAVVRDRTEGNPLFVTHLVDQLLDGGAVVVDHEANELRLTAADITSHVPRSLRALIEQRADVFTAEEREALEAASVEGVSFWSGSVAAAIGVDPEAVENLCTRLNRRLGFLQNAPDPGIAPAGLGARYAFRHALYQQVLYESIEVSRRQRLHRAIGTSLRELWGTRAAGIAAELASHFEHGGDLVNAIRYYDKAAFAAAGQGANREAVDYLDRGLALLERCEEGPQRRQRQLDLLLSRGPSVLATFGYGSTQVLDNYGRALELARQLDNAIPEMSSLLALAICEQTRANLAAGERFALELVRVAERNLPPPFVAQVHNPLSQIRLHQGAVTESLALSDAAVAAIDVLPMPTPPPESRPALWAEPRVMLHCQRAAASFALGLLTQAGAAIESAVAIAHELRHPFNLTYALSYASLYEDTVGRWDAAIRLARQAMDIAHEHDIPFWEGVARIFLGHALACSEDPGLGCALLREGFEQWRGTGGRLATTMHLNMLADACLAGDDVAMAQTALNEAAAHAERTGERVFLAENLRLQAVCLRRRGAPAAEQARMLRRAIAISRDQGTRLWELRATLALHRLRRSAASRRELAAICHTFDAEPALCDVAAARKILGA